MKPYEVLEAEVHQLIEENQFLRQRNTDLRQKSWINVYDENLKLIEENKNLYSENVITRKTIDQLRKELIQVGQVADKYYRDAVKINEENKKLKEVLKSVETFIGQYAIR